MKKIAENSYLPIQNIFRILSHKKTKQEVLSKIISKRIKTHLN